MNLSVLTSQTYPPESPNVSCDSSDFSSLGVFLLALGASEFMVYLVCRWMACYANTTFYSQSLEWIHTSSSESAGLENGQREEIVRALSVSDFNSMGTVNESCCPICLTDFERDDKVARGKCHHAFHETCLVEWLTKHTSCPCCRHPIIHQNQDETGVGSFEGQMTRMLSFPYREASPNDPALFMFAF